MGKIVFLGNIRAQNQGFTGSVYHRGAIALRYEREIIKSLFWWLRDMQVGIIDNSGYEHANRVYKGGECPALQSRDFKDPIKVVKRMKKTATIIGEMDNSDGTFESANRIYGHRGQLLLFQQPVVVDIHQK